MNLNELVRQAGRLYSLPDICLRLQELIARQASVLEIADLIALDPALTARLLRLANSSFYNFPAQVESVSRAVRLIGTNELYNLALATSAVAAFQRVPRELMDMDKFWEHSVYTGLIARGLGRRSGFRQGERLFAAGLLHNIGLLVLLEQAPSECAAMLQKAEGGIRPDLEQASFGFRVADLGHALMTLWRLPTSLTEVVRHQHEPEAANGERVACALVHVGMYGARHLQAGFSPEADSPLLAPLRNDRLQLASADTVLLKEALTSARDCAMQVLNIIAPGAAVVV
ncbi:HDOD domain-containing protein [Permianibacter sp. IMCC34836]|uniref:HDOD domain-containing protein n=1 Tax=Permianibacter fluminis TaxID=2738515 RepID=UPI001551E388|nr:HDOD domain-containing protein [Permianibacter fluminis]NQD35506.1 HDOD domain-containing protein [Permianibacter fluminis]